MNRVIFVALLVTACGGGAVPVKLNEQPASTARTADASDAPDATDAVSAVSSGVPAPREDGRLPSNAQPVGYALDFNIDPSKTAFSGRARIRVTMANPARAIVLHARDLAIQKVAATTSSGTIGGRAWSRPSFGVKAAAEELVVEFEEELPSGAAEIELDYEAPFSDGLRGLYRTEESGRFYAFTQFEAIDARRAFPCFDEPDNKTPFQVTIRAPNGLLAVANMPEVARREDRAGFTTFEFDTSPPLPTYLVALAVGPLEILEGRKLPVPVRLVAVHGQSALGKYALDVAAAHVDLLGKYFDQPYPYPKLDVVAVPDFAYGAMENAGLVTFREDLLLVDPKHASTSARRGVAEAIAHELSHQWFGDLVTMRWWDDLWLNESFATWMSGKILDQWKPSSAARLELIGAKSAAMTQDSLAAARPIRRAARSATDILEAGDGLTYFKGSAVLGMVEAWLGADRFRDGMRLYMKKHAWGNVTASDLYESLAEANAGLDVAAVMQSFTEQSGVPLVSAELTCDERTPSTSAILLRQEEYRTLDRAEGSDKRWRIPVCVVFDAGGSRGRQCTLLGGAEGRIDLPLSKRCPSFFYANADEAGYYRVRPARAELGHGSELSRSQLSEPERFGVLTNAWASVWSGELPASAYLQMITRLRPETSLLVWKQVIDTLFEADRTIISAAAQDAWAQWVRGAVGPAARRIGWKQKPGESDDRRILRNDLLVALGRLGQDAPTIAEAKRVAKQWFADPDQVDPDLGRVGLVLTAKNGDPMFFDRLVLVLRKATTPEIRQLALRALASFDRPELVSGALALILDGTVKDQDIIEVLAPLVRRRQTALLTFDWIKQHFDDVIRMAPSFVIQEALPSVTSSLCNEKDVRAVDAFLRPRFQRADWGVKALDEAVEAGLRCALLVERQAAPTAAWLQSTDRAAP